MIKLIGNLTAGSVHLIAAVAINLSLFSLLPIAHNLFGTLSDHATPVSTKPKIIAEYIRPPKKEEKKEPQSAIRKMQSPSSSQPLQSAMNFKFTPDLGVESGDGVAMAQQNLEAMVFEDGQTDVDAAPIGTLKGIPYPDRARQLGIEGVLEALLVIGVDGSVASVEIRSSPHPSISAEAKKVFSTWKFSPARNMGVPVTVRKKQVVEFRLNS